MQVQTSPRNEQSHPFVSMRNQYDILFLLERARVNDYELVLHEPARTGSKPYLTFGPSESTTPVYRFEWGKSLLSFRYSLDVSEQVGTLEVRSWDRGANGPIVGTASWTARDHRQGRAEADGARQPGLREPHPRRGRPAGPHARPRRTRSRSTCCAAG